MNLLIQVKQRAPAFLIVLLLAWLGLGMRVLGQPFDQRRGMVLHGTIVTMDPEGTIKKNGGVLVRNDKIVATWSGPTPPTGTPIGDAMQIDIGPDVLIFPGLINLHDHPSYDIFELWPPPSFHKQPSLGRPDGTEPYANRYQWNGAKAPSYARSPRVYSRLIQQPYNELKKKLGPEMGKYAQVKAILGGETASEGGQHASADNVLIRNVEHLDVRRATTLGTTIERRHGTIDSRVRPISRIDPRCSACPSPTPDLDCLDCLLAPMKSGLIDAWIVHLAEGVRDSQRRHSDNISSRKEFQILKNRSLLTDLTVIVHGIALEQEDFAAMHDAPSIRQDGTGDGLGAKLVWSPLSDLLLYGQTTLVYQALKENVVVSLGTDWSPSGSRNLLDELKIADIALRDSRLVGADRDLVQSLSIKDKSGAERKDAETALDKLLVEMVTTNPARTLRWFDELGSIERGKSADLVLITKHSHPSAEGLPDSPYRNLIDATERDVRLVLVKGEPLAGDVAVMGALKPSDYEVITCAAGCFEKAIDVTNPNAGEIGAKKFRSVQKKLADALHEINSKIELSPVFVEDDHFYFHVLGHEVSAHSGLIADDKPPIPLYLANFNHVQRSGNPFAAPLYRDRYYHFCTE